MSDNIPFEIQTEIIKRVSDVKSLLQFRSVSKHWKSVIDAPEFIAGYRAHRTQPRRLLLVSKNVQNYREVKYLSVDNDTLTQQQELDPNVSAFVKQSNGVYVIGFSRGLVCLIAFSNNGARILILWNPSIRKCVGVVALDYYRMFGFAVCPHTNEPTIVKILFPSIKIFTLSSKKWTEIQCRSPRESFATRSSQVVIGSCIYRVACHRIPLQDGSFTHQYIILSFDLIAKEFRSVDLPDTIAHPITSNEPFSISKLKGSLVVIVPHTGVKVWKMEPNCSFTQLFTINTSCITNIVGFRKNGELVVETQDERTREFISLKKESALEVYDLCSHHISNLGFSGLAGEFFLSSYKETLLLLDHPDSCVYP